MEQSLIIKIVSGLAFIYLLYYIYSGIINYYRNRYIIVGEPIVSTKEIGVQSSLVPIKGVGHGLSYSISTWIYVSNWNYLSGKKKNIITRGDFNLYLDENYNNLILNIPTFDSKKKGTNVQVFMTDESVINTVVYNNFPLQKWINVVIVVNNRSVDIWLNGKLYKSRIFDNLIYGNDNEPLVLLKNGGYDGYISRTYYYDRSLNRKEIIEIFNEEPMATNFIGKMFYRLLTYNKSHTDINDIQKNNNTNTNTNMIVSKIESVPPPVI